MKATKMPIYKFMIQVIVSFMVMIFSMAMIVLGKDTNVYIPILTGTLGYWMPQPSPKSGRTIDAPISGAQPV
jgi:hypothetical protein